MIACSTDTVIPVKTVLLKKISHTKLVHTSGKMSTESVLQEIPNKLKISKLLKLVLMLPSKLSSVLQCAPLRRIYNMVAILIKKSSSILCVELTSTNVTGCYYKRLLFKKDDKWQDGFDFNYRCLNGNTGSYQCSDMCTTWQLPQVYKLISPLPGKCCS